MPENNYRYLPWVRQGVASVISAQPGTSPEGRAGVTIKVRLNAEEAHDVPLALELYGPGDVTGLDAREVIRTDPVHLTTDFEPNYLATIEFDRPDFPWLFTPAPSPAASQTPQGVSTEKLQPWLCLVVVEKRDDPSVQFKPGTPLPTLTITRPTAASTDELPDLAQAWAWAHAQVTGATPQDLASVLAGDPQRSLSRLVCPRRLRANTSYLACVVPSFEAGRLTGLGLPPANPPSPLAPAWPQAWTSVTLPVYYHWEFATALVEGDFESLVWRLMPRPGTDLSKVGIRHMNVDNPGFGLPAIGELPLEGALRLSEPTVIREPNRGLEDFQRALVGLLNNTSGTPVNDLPMPPPIYGRWHAGQPTVSTSDTGWLHELNVTPQYRVAANLGTRVVQEQQEQLMAAAWEQVAEIDRANQALRQAQLARETIASLRTRHFVKMPAARLVQITAPLHARVLMSPHTVEQRIVESALPKAAVSPPLRRITRPRGPFAHPAGQSEGREPHFIQRLARGEIKIVPPATAVDATVRMDAVFQSLGMTQRLLTTAAPARLRTFLDIPTLTPAQKAFGAAALTVQLELSAFQQPGPLPPPPPGSDTLLDDIRNAMMGDLGRLDPRVTIPARLKKRLDAPPTWNPRDDLEPIMAAPEFPAPMYRPLADLSQDWLLPGLEHIPPNTVCLAAPNPQFIEAYLVGLNHEMSRELLWREFPTDQRGTYFARFWSARVQASGSPARPLMDIKGEIHKWEPASELGTHLHADERSRVLIIRGELLRRYPRAVIYAAKGAWIDNPKGPNPPKVRVPLKDDVSFPVFEGSLPPDLVFLGFVTEGAQDWTGSPDPAHANPGWFIVFQQQPTEPRFGLDESPPGTPTGTWRDLSWTHVDLDGGQKQHVDLGQPLLGFQPPPPSPDQPVAWETESNSAAIAFITQQDPFRLAIHAARLAL